MALVLLIGVLVVLAGVTVQVQLGREVEVALVEVGEICRGIMF